MRAFLSRRVEALICLGLVLLCACGTSGGAVPTPAISPIAAVTIPGATDTPVAPTMLPTTPAPRPPTPTLVPTTLPEQVGVPTTASGAPATPAVPTTASVAQVATYTHPEGLWSVQYSPALLQIGDLGEGVTIFITQDRSTFAAVDTYLASGNEFGNTGEGLRNRARATLERIYGKPVNETGIVDQPSEPWETGITFVTDGGSTGEGVYEQRERTEGDLRVTGFLYGYKAASEAAALPLLEAMRSSFMTAAPTTVSTPATSSFVYVDQGNVWEQAAGGAPKQVAQIPEGSAVLAAHLSGDALLLLREGGVERMVPGESSATVVQRFDLPARFGSFTATADGKHVIYTASMDDPQSPFGLTTRLGVYDVDIATTQAVTPTGDLAAAFGLAPLGLTPDGVSMYLLPRGQDPSFVRIAVVSVATGELERDLPIAGEGGALLSPDGTAIVVAAPCRRASAGGQSINVLQFYDLRQEPLQPREVSLPPAPCYLAGLAWVPDGSALYALTMGQAASEPPYRPALLRVDAQQGSTIPVARLDQAEYQLVAVRPDGTSLLVRNATEPAATLVELPSGTLTNLALPVGAAFAGWR